MLNNSSIVNRAIKFVFVLWNKPNYVLLTGRNLKSLLLLTLSLYFQKKDMQHSVIRKHSAASRLSSISLAFRGITFTFVCLYAAVDAIKTGCNFAWDKTDKKRIWKYQ